MAPADRFAYRFLGGAATVHLGGVGQPHPEIEAEAERRELVLAAPRIFGHLREPPSSTRVTATKAHSVSRPNPRVPASKPKEEKGRKGAAAQVDGR